ncbi:DUF1304 domain-containing protein [Bifidobacterium mongoliense]|uniref:DUF1304 domain-containing protein n=1 Tax=Bifidobacterium mongoliense TaxID=518643 RepID=UPI0026479D82|nr:DUF1304 domain-containing protein [Bifidobacterium mongoliense]MDN6024771.1 DUF1304 domain-containing protein [Bifidobacterium mongoliense]MDN6050842.1 DUF1304 domain-containing protein [Bifidobacterium mongoliense]
MIIAGMIIAVLAALLHIFIFYLEAFAWDSEQARHLFKTGSVEQAQLTKSNAYNQGFYNLFLAVIALAGVIAWFVNAHTVGLSLVFSGAGSMLAAALVLFVSSAPHRSAAVKQGALPLLAVLLVILGLLM